MDKLFDTYKPSKNWLDSNPETRKKILSEAIGSLNLDFMFEVISVPDNGQIVLKTNENISARDRGMYLLNLERKLKDAVDQGITIWLEPVGDKSKLRQLRGVQFS